MRKGQGLSVNMLILIALGLIVLIIAVVLLVNTSRRGTNAIGACESLGGTCNDGTQCPPGTTVNAFATSCATAGKSLPCCVSTSTT